MEVSKRPAADSDFDFLYALHKAALGPYVDATWGWEEDFQRTWFEERFDPVANQVILVDGVEVGCLRALDEPDCVFLDYIALVDAWQGKGLGGSLVRELQAAAAARGLPVRLRVLKANPAKSLYDRLGFRVIEEDDVRWVMEYRSEPTTTR